MGTVYAIKLIGLEFCADFIVYSPARRWLLVGPKIGGGGLAAQFPNVAYLFQTLFSKELML